MWRFRSSEHPARSWRERDAAVALADSPVRLHSLPDCAPERGYRRVCAAAAAMGDRDPCRDRQWGQHDAGWRVHGAEARHDGLTLVGGDEREHGGEVVALVSDARLESGGLADALGGQPA